MYQYFAFNILYSLIVFMYLYSLKTAPFRVRFRFVLIAMVSWLMPYDLINNFLTQNSTLVFSSAISEFNNDIKQVITAQVNPETFITFMNLFLAMTFIGFIWFIKDLVSLKIKLQRLNKHCSYYEKIGNCEIYEINGNEIFTVGLIDPKIYIAKKYLNSPLAESIIKHELQHIRSNDQLWLALITFIQRLMWWNPIVYLLALKGRELIELSCDQACKKQSQNNQYQKDLAQILIESNQANNLLASNFFGQTKQNIFRIKQLSQEFSMNNKHKSLIFSTAFIPFVLMLLVSTASSEGTMIKDNNDKIVLAKDEVDLTVKVTTTDTTKIEVNTQIIEARMISKYGSPTVLESEELNLEFHAKTKYVDNEKIFIAFEIIYTSSNGKQKTITPSMMVANGTRAVIDLVDDETADYKIEIEVLPRF